MEFTISIIVFILGVLMLSFVVYTNWINKDGFLQWASKNLFSKKSNPESSAVELVSRLTPFFLTLGIIFSFIGSVRIF